MIQGKCSQLLRRFDMAGIHNNDLMNLLIKNEFSGDVVSLIDWELNRGCGQRRSPGPEEESAENDDHPQEHADTASQNKSDGSALPRPKEAQRTTKAVHEFIVLAMSLSVMPVVFGWPAGGCESESTIVIFRPSHNMRFKGSIKLFELLNRW